MSKKEKNLESGSPSPSIITVTGILSQQHAMMKKIGLTYASYRDVIILIDHYLKEGTGLRQFSINRTTDCGAAHRNVRKRLSRLIERGYVLKSANLYFPTEKAIEELKETFGLK